MKKYGHRELPDVLPCGALDKKSKRRFGSGGT